MSEEIDQEIVEQLRASYQAHGPREKVVLDAKGEVVDGHQRKVAVPEWPEETNQNLKTDEDVLLYQIDKNWHRTNKSDNWKRDKIGRLAKLGNNVQAIVKKTGLPERTVYRYFPQELKNEKISEETSKAKKTLASTLPLGKPSSKIQDEQLPDLLTCPTCGKSVKICDAKHLNGKDVCSSCYGDAVRLVQCPACHLGKPFHTFKVWHGHFMCGDCNKDADTNPTVYEHKFPKVELPKNLEPKIHKPATDLTWQDRFARMHYRISEMDKGVFIGLSQHQEEIAKLGYRLVFQKEYTKIICVSDVSFEKIDSSKPDIACFHDGEEAHRKSHDRDEAARNEIESWGVEVLPFPYKSFSPKLCGEICDKIMHKLREQGA